MSDLFDFDPPVSGRAKGGKARMSSMTPEQRSAQARNAALRRWKAKPLLKATHTGELPLGDTRIQCYVLEDGTRVISQRGLNEAFGIEHGGSASYRGQKMPRFVAAKALEPYLSRDLTVGITKPIRFTPPHGGNPVQGIPATALPEVCNAWLSAREARVLNDRQLATAQMAEIIMRGLAHIGIIALVDEATGYQKDRAKDALAKILEAFVAKELQAWVQTFPAEFYEHLFRLRGLEFPANSVQRPKYFGALTNDIVYRRLAPGVLEELKRVTPRTEDGRPKAKYFQSLTGNFGYPKLKEHLGAVVALMKINRTWDGFMALLNEHYPRFGDTIMLPMDYDQGSDSGHGL
jgi:hypothetical protein